MEKTLAMLNDFFYKNDDLRLFTMNGSKVNTNIPSDKFQDYDVVFFTNNIKKYSLDKTFLNQFGEILLLSEPELSCIYEPSFPSKDGYIFLVQYKNGVRIDLQFRTINQIHTYLKEDTLTKIISDKDYLLQEEIIPSDQQYHINKPTGTTINSSINEFWWQYINTLKANIREDFLLAQFYLNITRNELLRITAWEVGSHHGFNRSYGKFNTQILNYLSEENSRLLWQTYRTDSKDSIFNALKIMALLEIEISDRLEDMFCLDEKLLRDYENVAFEYLLSKSEPVLAKTFQHLRGPL